MRQACAEGDTEAATTIALEAYGSEVLGFLIGTAGDEATALDAFSGFSISVWRGLPGFRWECSLRTWCYVLARRAVGHAKRPQRDAVPLDSAVVAGLVDTITTATMPYIRAQQREGLVALRDELPEDDRMLLTLRVDRELGWHDVARVFCETPQDEEALARTSASLRKRFERTKKRLRELAVERGLA